MTIEDNLRIGIDVGGTNTDAVVVNSSNNVIAKTKTPTTSDIQSGISTALGSVLSGLTESVDRITHVMLGTTHATNAILEIIKYAIINHNPVLHIGVRLENMSNWILLMSIWCEYLKK